MPKKSKRKGKKGKKGKKKVHPDPPPYYPVTLPSPYLFGQIVGKSVQEKDVSEAKAQALVDDANAKTLVLDFKGLHLDEMPLRMTKLINLTHLHLQHNNLFSCQRVFDAISNCEELVDINLSYNMLNGQIPDTVRSLKRLKQLNLKGNMITGFSQELGECTMMEVFDVTNNKLKEITEGVLESWGALKQLRVSGNKITVLPRSVSALKEITHIDASKNSIAEIPGGVLQNLNVLRFLNLSSNGLQLIPEDIGAAH